MRRILCFCLIIFIPALAVSQTVYRGSIPEELLRPKKGESPYYPIDLVIGELGRGSADAQAYEFAGSVGNGFLSGLTGNPALSSVNSAVRENHIAALNIISPEIFRIGGGRQEADGAVSFLVRFIGKEQAITGELYIRYSSDAWVFEDLLLDEATGREIENVEIMNRNDYNPYERFY